MKLDLVIQNGEVVIPKLGVYAYDIGVKNGKITSLFERGTEVNATRSIDVTGKHIFPGVIDAHEHLGIYNTVEEDFKDTFQHAVGGVTTVVNYDRQPVSYLEFFPKVREIGEKYSYIDFTYSLGILKEQHLDELEETVSKFGLTSFKFFRNYERQLNDKFKMKDGIDLSSNDMVRILTQFKSISPKLLLAVHCENMDVNRTLIQKYKLAGEDDGLKTWAKTSPGFAEAESLLSTLYLNNQVGGNVFIVHLSSGASVDVLDKVPWLVEKGVKIETCPHYLSLHDEHEVGLKAKVGPPIHGRSDAEKLWKGIQSGKINAIGTDHVPNSLSTKFANGTGTYDAAYGFPSVGALLPIMITEGHLKRGIPLERIADLTSAQVADSFNLDSKGRIEVGADADFAIVDLTEKKTVSTDVTYGHGDYNIFDSMELSGWPTLTISRGDIIVADGKPTKESGRGKFVKRSI